MRAKVKKIKDELLREIDEETYSDRMSKEEALWVLNALAEDFECRCDALREDIRNEKDE